MCISCMELERTTIQDMFLYVSVFGCGVSNDWVAVLVKEGESALPVLYTLTYQEEEEDDSSPCVEACRMCGAVQRSTAATTHILAGLVPSRIPPAFCTHFTAVMNPICAPCYPQ